MDELMLWLFFFLLEKTESRNDNGDFHLRLSSISVVQKRLNGEVESIDLLVNKEPVWSLFS